MAVRVLSTEVTSAAIAVTVDAGEGSSIVYTFRAAEPCAQHPKRRIALASVEQDGRLAPRRRLGIAAARRAARRALDQEP